MWWRRKIRDTVRSGTPVCAAIQLCPADDPTAEVSYVNALSSNVLAEYS